MFTPQLKRVWKPALILLAIFSISLSSCDKSESEDDSQAKGFVQDSQGDLKRECDFKQGSLENIARYFKELAYKVEHLPADRASETYRNMSIAGWEYLYCLVKGDLQPGSDLIALPADLLLDHLKREKVIPEDVPGIVKQLIDLEQGIYLERLGSSGTEHKARLVLNLNTGSMKDQSILAKIESMISPHLGSEMMERKFIKADKDPQNIAFGKIPRDFVEDKDIDISGNDINPNKEIDSIFIIYEASFMWVQKTIISAVNKQITIDISIDEETFLTPEKQSFKGVSTVNIGNINGLGLYGGDESSGYFEMGGNLAKVFKNFRITRADLDFNDSTGKASIFGGTMKSTLDFSALFNGKEIKSEFDKDLVVPTLGALSQGYIEAAGAEFKLIYFDPGSSVFSNRDYLLAEYYYKDVGTVEQGVAVTNPEVASEEDKRKKVKIWINGYLGSDNPPEKMVKELVKGIYEYLLNSKTVYERAKSGEVEHAPPAASETLSEYLYETFVENPPHIREVEVNLPFVDAQSYYEFASGIDSFD